MRQDRDHYKPGDPYVIDDVTGFKVRQSQTRKQWNGLVVDERFHEERHPQEFVRGLKDDQTVKGARPRPPNVYIGPKSTALSADAAAGATALTVESSVGFAVADRVAVMLDNGDRHLGTVATVPGATSITLTAGLPWSAATGKAIINQTQVVAPTLG